MKLSCAFLYIALAAMMFSTAFAAITWSIDGNPTRVQAGTTLLTSTTFEEELDQSDQVSYLVPFTKFTVAAVNCPDYTVTADLANKQVVIASSKYQTTGSCQFNLVVNESVAATTLDNAFLYGTTPRTFTNSFPEVFEYAFALEGKANTELTATLHALAVNGQVGDTILMKARGVNLLDANFECKDGATTVATGVISQVDYVPQILFTMSVAKTYFVCSFKCTPGHNDFRTKTDKLSFTSQGVTVDILNRMFTPLPSLNLLTTSTDLKVGTEKTYTAEFNGMPVVSTSTVVTYKYDTVKFAKASECTDATGTVASAVANANTVVFTFARPIDLLSFKCTLTLTSYGGAVAEFVPAQYMTIAGVSDIFRQVRTTALADYTDVAKASAFDTSSVIATNYVGTQSMILTFGGVGAKGNKYELRGYPVTAADVVSNVVATVTYSTPDIVAIEMLNSNSQVSLKIPSGPMTSNVFVYKYDAGVARLITTIAPPTVGTAAFTLTAPTTATVGVPFEVRYQTSGFGVFDTGLTFHFDTSVYPVSSDVMFEIMSYDCTVGRMVVAKSADNHYIRYRTETSLTYPTMDCTVKLFPTRPSSGPITVTPGYKDFGFSSGYAMSFPQVVANTNTPVVKIDTPTGKFISGTSTSLILTLSNVYAGLQQPFHLHLNEAYTVSGNAVGELTCSNGDVLTVKVGQFPDTTAANTATLQFTPKTALGSGPNVVCTGGTVTFYSPSLVSTWTYYNSAKTAYPATGPMVSGLEYPKIAASPVVNAGAPGLTITLTYVDVVPLYITNEDASFDVPAAGAPCIKDGVTFGAAFSEDGTLYYKPSFTALNGCSFTVSILSDIKDNSPLYVTIRNSGSYANVVLLAKLTAPTVTSTLELGVVIVQFNAGTVAGDLTIAFDNDITIKSSYPKAASSTPQLVTYASADAVAGTRIQLYFSQTKDTVITVTSTANGYSRTFTSYMPLKFSKVSGTSASAKLTTDPFALLQNSRYSNAENTGLYFRFQNPSITTTGTVVADISTTQLRSFYNCTAVNADFTRGNLVAGATVSNGRLSLPISVTAATTSMYVCEFMSTTNVILQANVRFTVADSHNVPSGDGQFITKRVTSPTMVNIPSQRLYFNRNTVFTAAELLAVETLYFDLAKTHFTGLLRSHIKTAGQYVGDFSYLLSTVLLEVVVAIDKSDIDTTSLPDNTAALNDALKTANYPVSGVASMDSDGVDLVCSDPTVCNAQCGACDEGKSCSINTDCKKGLCNTKKVCGPEPGSAAALSVVSVFAIVIAVASFMM